MTSQRFVLLCAEDDDLGLVRWVHDARQRGLQPEVVSGVELDDAPMLDALADRGCSLFVLLRSEHMGADRMRHLKTAFAAHRHPTQRLVALRLELAAAAALDRIAAELGKGERPRSEVSMVSAIEDVLADVAVPDVPPAPVAPRGPAGAPIAVPTAEARRRSDRRTGARRRVTTAQHEVTGRIACDDETLPMSLEGLGEPIAAGPPRASRAGVWLAAVGFVAVGATALAIASGVGDATATQQPRAIDRASSELATPANVEAPNVEAPIVEGTDEAVRIRVASPEEPELPTTHEDVRRVAKRRATTRPTEVAPDARPAPDAPSATDAATPASAMPGEVTAAVGAPLPAASSPSVVAAPVDLPVDPAPLEDDVERKLPR